ncbi:hypothetical protein GCM10010172_32420 [Paractinoplanes ferrugineus]|uniref:Uncharacterized protein n=1 Tax=Paractinoplanes ferrugineus TaxID=113564 RepID=A0A919J9G2_9ACTN|nr:hypothetical protein [Actinoplanes ferrugineus]GIE16598.1 hypothetical protein Afe05nite_84380 [Actinoplanes ferrugineus]
MAYGFDNLVAKGDIPGLHQSLSSARRNVARLIEVYVNEDLATKSDLGKNLQSIRAARRTISMIANGELSRSANHATRQSIHVGTAYLGDGVTVHDESKRIQIGNVSGSITGIVGIDAKIQNSFQQLGNSTADTGLKRLLEELILAVSNLAKELPQADGEAVGRELSDFTGEATSDAPRRRVLETFGDGLRKAAELASEVGTPVIALVNAVIAMF